MKRNANVVKENISAIRVGNDVYELVKTSDNRGVTVRNGQGSMFIPNGAAGKAIAEELLTLTRVVVPRKRRTKAEMAAEGNES